MTNTWPAVIPKLFQVAPHLTTLGENRYSEVTTWFELKEHCTYRNIFWTYFSLVYTAAQWKMKSFYTQRTAVLTENSGAKDARSYFGFDWCVCSFFTCCFVWLLNIRILFILFLSFSQQVFSLVIWQDLISYTCVWKVEMSAGEKKVFSTVVSALCLCLWVM